MYLQLLNSLLRPFKKHPCGATVRVGSGGQGNKVFKAIVKPDTINMMDVPPIRDFPVCLLPHKPMLKVPAYGGMGNTNSAIPRNYPIFHLWFSIPSQSVIIAISRFVSNWLPAYRASVALPIRPSAYRLVNLLSFNIIIHNVHYTIREN